MSAMGLGTDVCSDPSEPLKTRGDRRQRLVAVELAVRLGDAPATQEAAPLAAHAQAAAT